ncbi:hypothetical protein [Salinigranum sp.]|uniref:hypothetical protein n=1 Tax=Salinigranum sp. TaxID=1966351 RepID=UPI003561A4E2
MSRPDRSDGFVAFFQRYVQTWVHALSTAALTLFGTLTFVHRLFAAVAVGAYVLPPVVLYLTRSTDRPDASRATRSPSRTSGETNASAPADSDSEPADSDPADSDSEPADSDPADSDSEPADSGPGPTDSGSSAAIEPHWTAATTPVDDTLHDVVVQSGAYAVGADGTVLADEGDGWHVVLSDGPGAASNTLRGVDAVADGGVWVAGDGGAVGRLDPVTGRHVDYSAPAGDTTNVTGLAAAGGDGVETVLLADGSGRVRRGRWEDGETTWADPVTPGSGSSLAGVVLVDDSLGYVCDTNDGVFRTTDGGVQFDRAGSVGASGTLADVTATASVGPLVVDDDGALHRYDGSQWTPTRLADDALCAVASAESTGNGDADADANGDRDVDAVACGTGAVVYERPTGTSDWTRVTVPASTALSGVALDGSAAVAVGADGTVVERVTDAR